MYNDWRDLHGNVMLAFISFLNSSQNRCYILKGGTSLMFCYGLTRFSEDIDLDACHTQQGIDKVLKAFCTQYNYTYRVAKDTSTVKRYMVHYNSDKPLKIEISYRRSNISENEFTYINNIAVYTIANILSFKLIAYSNRDKLRDLYDIVFICKNYWNVIPDILKTQVMNALSYKGLEHFDYLSRTQYDNLIDINVLGNEFLDLYTRLGLL
jgi:predicted nucleotidyltransferase component of viral defense system